MLPVSLPVLACLTTLLLLYMSIIALKKRPFASKRTELTQARIHKQQNYTYHTIGNGFQRLLVPRLFSSANLLFCHSLRIKPPFLPLKQLHRRPENEGKKSFLCLGKLILCGMFVHTHVLYACVSFFLWGHWGDIVTTETRERRKEEEKKNEITFHPAARSLFLFVLLCYFTIILISVSHNDISSL
jgi:hypothetical protein